MAPVRVLCIMRAVHILSPEQLLQQLCDSALYILANVSYSDGCVLTSRCLLGTLVYVLVMRFPLMASISVRNIRPQGKCESFVTTPSESSTFSSP